MPKIDPRDYERFEDDPNFTGFEKFTHKRAETDDGGRVAKKPRREWKERRGHDGEEIL